MRARASISSLVRRPAPHSRATRRNGALVTPAIGASLSSSPDDVVAMRGRVYQQVVRRLDDGWAAPKEWWSSTIRAKPSPLRVEERDALVVLRLRQRLKPRVDVGEVRA